MLTLINYFIGHYLTKLNLSSRVNAINFQGNLHFPCREYRLEIFQLVENAFLSGAGIICLNQIKNCLESQVVDFKTAKPSLFK